MALLDTAIRTQGLEQARVLFPILRDLKIAIRLPRYILVNNTFVRIQRLKEIKTTADKKEAFIKKAMADRQWPFQRNIAFREYVQFGGTVTFAFQGMEHDALTLLLEQINYLGKRGGFIQLLSPPTKAEEMPNGFTLLTESTSGTFPLGTLQMLDDCGPKVTFEQVDVFNPRSIKLGKDRLFHYVILPHRPVRYSKGFTLYES